MGVSVYSVTSLYSESPNRRLRAWYPKVTLIPSLYHVSSAYFGSHSMILYMHCCISYFFFCYKSVAAQGRFSRYAITQSSSALVTPPSNASSTTFTSRGPLCMRTSNDNTNSDYSRDWTLRNTTYPPHSCFPFSRTQVFIQLTVFALIPTFSRWGNNFPSTRFYW